MVSINKNYSFCQINNSVSSDIMMPSYQYRNPCGPDKEWIAGTKPKLVANILYQTDKMALL